MLFNPPAEAEIEGGDFLIAMGETANLHKLEQMLTEVQRVKVLTAAQMREVDRRTSELGMPGLVLMENAGQRVVELLAHAYAPLREQRIVVMCGKGNNGGDGLVVARQLYTRFRPRTLHVVLAADPGELEGDAAANYSMLEAVGCPVSLELTPEMETATLIVDALLGTGIHGRGKRTRRWN